MNITIPIPAKRIDELHREVERLMPRALESDWHQRKYREAHRRYRKALAELNQCVVFGEEKYA